MEQRSKRGRDKNKTLKMKKKDKSNQVQSTRAIARKISFYVLVVLLAGGIVGIASFLSDWLVYNIPVIGQWIMPLTIGIAIFVVVNLYWQKSKQVEESYEVEKKAHKELLRLTEVKDEFILATQHHLRTPLSIIKGYLAAMEGLMAKNNFNKAEVREYLRKTVASANRLTGLVDELLDITQMEMGRESARLMAANPRDIIEEVVEELHLEIMKKKLRVGIIPKKGWPKLMLEPKKIKMAFFNLIDNAIKYTQKGDITISGKKAGKFFQIAIRDEGIGIGPAEIRTIFEKYFERGKKAKELNVTGRGIGLYITASAISDHNGRVYARSGGINRGSEFVVELPME